MKALEVCELPRLRRLVLPASSSNSFKHLHLQLFLDSDRNHVVIWYLILRHQSGHSPLPSRHCAARAFSFTSFTSFASLTSSKSFTIRTSKTPLPQLLYNPHLRAPLGSAGNKGLITPLESALTKNSPVTSLESALTKTGGWRASRLTTNHPPPSLTFARLAQDALSMTKTYLEAAIEIAQEAGKILIEEFSRPVDIRYKGDEVDL